MPYKYVKSEKELDEPKIIETKEIEKPKTLTEEESRLELVKKFDDLFYGDDEDSETIEVNFD